MRDKPRIGARGRVVNPRIGGMIRIGEKQSVNWEEEEDEDTHIENCVERESQPVIPPPLGVGGGRCSVKPASRCALHSKSQETLAFTKLPRLNSRLGVGRLTYCRHIPTQQASVLFHHIDAPTWVTSWSNPTQRSDTLSVKL
ncbi:hypothetical protein VNO80_25973 [Phaseolus coccineus]|uniref:Uncharacterized protein n=1 Tax=Phaseolus coccineus TaxID=3886 RepID=A0AAN9M0B4_PHACN